jgi:acylphosphatase
VDESRIEICVQGRVQGVGLRYWARNKAGQLGLTGSATNLPDGRVSIVAQGPRERCQQLLDALRGAEPPGAVTMIQQNWTDPHDAAGGFSVG